MKTKRKQWWILSVCLSIFSDSNKICIYTLLRWNKLSFQCRFTEAGILFHWQTCIIDYVTLGRFDLYYDCDVINDISWLWFLHSSSIHCFSCVCLCVWFQFTQLTTTCVRIVRMFIIFFWNVGKNKTFKILQVIHLHTLNWKKSSEMFVCKFLEVTLLKDFI